MLSSDEWIQAAAIGLHGLVRVGIMTATRAKIEQPSRKQGKKEARFVFRQTGP